MLSSVILIHSNSELNPCLQSFLNKSLQVSHKLFSWTVDTTQNHNMATVMVVVVVVERMLQSLSLHCGSHFGYLPPLLWGITSAHNKQSKGRYFSCSTNWTSNTPLPCRSNQFQFHYQQQSSRMFIYQIGVYFVTGIILLLGCLVKCHSLSCAIC